MLSHVGVFEDKLSCLGRTSHQDPVGSYMVLYFVGSYTGSWQDYIIERGDRILSRSKSGRILYQGGKVGRIMHRTSIPNMYSIQLKTKELQSKMYLTQTHRFRLLTHLSHKIGSLCGPHF